MMLYRPAKTVRPTRLLLTFLGLMALTGCSNLVKEVGVASYNTTDPFINTFVRQIEELAPATFRIESRNGQNSQMLQNEQIEDMLSEGKDLVIINPVDRLAAYSIIRRMKKLAIPAIFFNREPLREDLDLWENVYYVGARAEQSGQLQAELVMDFFGGDPAELNNYDRNGDNRIQAVILKGEQGHQDAELRTDQVIAAFAEKGFSLDILIIEVANWSENLAFAKMEEIIKKYGDRIEVILSNNDAMAIGAINRMRLSGWFRDTNRNGRIDASDDNWIPVVGIDGLEKAVDNIKKGYLYGTVLNDSRQQAKAIVELAQVLLGARKPREMTFPLEEGKYIWIDYQVFSLNEE